MTDDNYMGILFNDLLSLLSKKTLIEVSRKLTGKLFLLKSNVNSRVKCLNIHKYEISQNLFVKTFM